VSGFVAALMMLAMLLAGCGSDATPLDSEVARQFDVAGTSVVDLSSGVAGAIPGDALLAAVEAADAADTKLRVVISAADGEAVPAGAIVDRYGGTAISYQAIEVGFEAASRDMSAAQLDRAVAAARTEVDIGESAQAFVNVIADEGLQPISSAFPRWLLWVLLIPAGLFMLSGAWSYFQARKRRLKREQDFLQRRSVLRDWAAQLAPEIELLAPATAAGADPSARATLDEATVFVQSIGPKLDAAQSLGELDAAEMRIGRVAIKLRELRRILSV